MSHYQNRHPNIGKQNFTENEITGSYHNEKTDWFSIAIIAAVIFTAVVFIGEQTGIISKLLGTV